MYIQWNCFSYDSVCINTWCPINEFGRKIYSEAEKKGNTMSVLIKCQSHLPRKTASIINEGRSQWPRGLRHELSSLARTLGSWVWIPLKALVSVCAFILCLCCPVCGWRPCDGLNPRPRSPTVCVERLRNWRRGKGPTNGCSVIDEWLNYKRGSGNNVRAL
jgi:hypothetical protein